MTTGTKRPSARASKPVNPPSLVALQLAFARYTGRRPCAVCKGAGVVATSRRKADDKQCTACLPVAA